MSVTKNISFPPWLWVSWSSFIFLILVATATVLTNVTVFLPKKVTFLSDHPLHRKACFVDFLLLFALWEVIAEYLRNNFFKCCLARIREPVPEPCYKTRALAESECSYLASKCPQQRCFWQRERQRETDTEFDISNWQTLKVKTQRFNIFIWK